MTPDHSRKLIAAAGGNKAFAERLKLTGEKGYATRVDNWRTRGIPVAIQLLKRIELERLERSLKRRGLL